MGERARLTSSIEIAAPPERVYAMVSDLTRMGEWSPENRGGRWLGGATGPVVGARFKGHNARGRRRWAVPVTVTDATVPSRFAFSAMAGPKPVAEWSYDITPTDRGCQVTESWVDLRPALLVRLGDAYTGVRDRTPHTREMIETTLGRLKEAAERSAEA